MEQMIYNEEYGRARAPILPGSIGLSLAGPIIGEHQRPGGTAHCAAIWHPLFCGFSSVDVFFSPDLLTLFAASSSCLSLFPVGEEAPHGISFVSCTRAKETVRMLVLEEQCF
jgi:hypothetical protein